MNLDDGKIYKFDTQEALKIAEEKMNLVPINEEIKNAMEQFHEHERPQIYKDLVSKNHSARRRAKRKIAKASKQRNRR